MVIDEEDILDRKTKQKEPGFVHREAIHMNENNKETLKKNCEEIKPNPDRLDPEPMYLKRPRKLTKRLFEPHNKKLTMPQHLIDRYSKNNNK